MSANVTIVTGLSFLLAASGGAAQTPPPGQAGPPAAARYVDAVGGLSLDDAFALALRREPSMQAARTGTEAAVARRAQAGVRANPTTTFERRMEPGGTDNQTLVGLQLPLELFRRGARIAVADREIAVSRHEVADRERHLMADVRTRYGQVLAAIRDLSIVEDLLASARRQLDLVAARAGEGAVPTLERDLLDVDVRRLAADHRLQVGQVDSALVGLKRAIGLAPDTPLAVRETLETMVARESAALPRSGADAAPGQRPDVLAAEARLRTAEARVQQAASDGRFDVSVYGAFMRMDAGFPQLGVAPGGGTTRVRGVFNYVAAGAMVTIPVLDRSQGAAAAARAARTGAGADRDATVLQVQADLAAARIEDASAREAVAEYRDGARQLARQNLDVVGQTYTLGRATIFDVLAEQRRYLDVEKSYAAALRAAFDARTRLHLALGDFR